MKAFKKWFTDGCVIYTIISALLILYKVMTAENAAASAINTEAFLFLLPCGLTISAGGMALGIDALEGWLKRLIHYLLTALAILLFVILPADFRLSPSATLVLMVVLSLLYWLVYAIYAVTKSRVQKLLEEDKKERRK